MNAPATHQEAKTAAAAATANKVRSVRQLSLQNQRRVESIEVSYPHLDNILEHIDELYYQSREMENPGGLRIIGDQGTGKTWIRNKLLELYPAEAGKQKTVPVLAITVPQAPSVNRMLTIMLRAMGYQFIAGKNQDEMTDALAGAVIDCRTRLIVFDEFQEGSEGNRKITSQAITNWCKQFYDRTHIAQIYLATHKANEAFELNKMLADRLPARYFLEEFSYNPIFAGILKAFERALNLPEKSNIWHGEFSRKIFDAKCTRMRPLKLLLKETVAAATRDGANRLTYEHFCVGYRRLYADDSIGNPFQRADGEAKS